MKWFAEKKILATGFVFALTILTAISVISYQNTLRLIETLTQVAKTEKALHELEDLFSTLKDAEIGARGYIITGEDHYLEPYNASISVIDKEVLDLRKLTADNPKQQKRLNELEPLIKEKIGLLAKKIDLRRNKGFKAALQLTLTDIGEKISNDIRMVIKEMEKEENELLKMRIESSRISTQNTNRMLLLGSTTSFVIFLLIFYILSRENTMRRRAEEELRTANEELEIRVQERTAELSEANKVLQAEIIERKRVAELLRRQRNELDVRARILSAVIEIKDFYSQLKIILNEIIEFLQVEFGYIHLVRGKEVVLSHWHGISDEFRANVLSFNTDSVPDIIREAHVIHERLSEQQLMPEYAKKDGIQAYASIPLKLLSDKKDKSSEWLGSIMVCSRRYEALSEEDVKAMEVIADQIALAIDRARSYRQAEERLNRLQVLREIDKAIIQHIDLREVMHVVLEKVPKDFGADAAAISLFDEMQTQMRVFAFRRPNGTIIDEEAFSIADSLLHWFVDRQEIVIIYDLTQDPRVQMNREYIRNGRLISYLGVPLIVQDKTIGILHIMTTQPKIFEEEDVEFFRTMAGQTAIAIKNAQSSADLRESEKKYRSLFEESKDMVFISTPERRLLDINPAGIELFGYSSKEEMLRVDIAKDIYSDPEVRKEFVRLMEQNGFVKDFELVMKKKDGQKFTVLSTATAVHDEKGDIVAYRGIMRDVTEQKQVEEERNKFLDVVTKAKKEWEMTFDNAIEFIMVVDEEFNIIRCNKSFADFVRIPGNEILSRRWCDFFPFDPKQIGDYKNRLQAGEQIQKEVREDTGHWFFISCRPIFDEKGKFLNSIIIATDITDIKNTQQRLEESEEELKNRVKELEKFYKIAVGRELKMKELKKEIEQLKMKLSKYTDKK